MSVSNHPTYREFQAEGKQGKWGYIKFPSVSALRQFAASEVNPRNRSAWMDAQWAGLGEQSCEDFYSSGIARDAQKLMADARAKLPKKMTKLAEPRMAVTGGYWDTPSVLANLPLAARMRVRAKLPPLNLRIAFVLSAGIRAEQLAPMTAKIVAAIWDYRLSGGIVNLTVIDVGTYNRSGLAVEATVNTSNLSEVSIALHPLFSRLLGGPVQSEHFGTSSIGVPPSNPIKGTHWIGGPMQQVIRECENVLKTLQIA